MAAISGEEPVFKRRRVAQACQTCRKMKAKCDGRKPECSRCVGYGFTCLYAKTRSRRHEVNEDDGCDGPSSNAIDELRDAINGYDDLAHRLSSKKKQDKFDPKELHNQVKDRVKKALDRVADTRAADIASPSDQDRASQLTSSQNQHRYLGEVSDVHFFNLVKGFLQTKDLSSPEQDFDSYEQDGEVWTTNNESNGPTLLPGFAQTRDLVKLYPGLIEGSSAGDYFISVIGFSRIVGCVLRDIYGPAHSRPTPEMILSTQTLDHRLIEWKLSLPRKLRFDLGHSFDQNNTFRRQLDWPLIAVFEKICIDEAQGTARLLHHVSDEQELVHEFPWWQMISCLICAGSILLVSSIFAQQPDDHSGFDSEGLRDDAETCLKIFEALSSNSKSARIARNMIQGLKQSGSEWRSSLAQEMLGLEGQNVEFLSEAISTPQSWPAEIIDSMAWSSQFLDTIQGDGSWT
uniref:Zn(2)-C6 fungal-type domain-containing protein n=1 Tax=Fusarium oxysporum (strain Fo5176) TaxID=660025 RepID=A0A0D2XYQ4_FUSOF